MDRFLIQNIGSRFQEQVFKSRFPAIAGERSLVKRTRPGELGFQANRRELGSCSFRPSFRGILTRLRSNDGLSAFTNRKRWLTIAFMMEGGALQVTMRVFFLTTLALISVLVEDTTCSPPISTLDIGSVPVGLVERMDPGATASKLEDCNRKCADVANRKLAVQHGRDLTTLFSEQKTTVSSASLRVEVEALISFKEAVTTDFLGALSSWNPNDLSACHWKGVTCDLSSNRVIALELGHLQLVGSISPLLDRLQYLQNLDLSGNIFSGEIPPSLHNCSKLSHLTLRDNNLTGQIPSQLGELLNLKYLDLSGNFLLGGNFPASLGNCSQLRSLLLNFTNVEGVIPYTVGQLTHLEILNVSATALSGAIPGSLGNCSSLTQLLLGNMYKLPFFYTGTMHTMGLSGELPMEIGSLTRLNVFEIQGSQIGGRFPNWIANLTRLTDLTLGHSSFNGEIPQFLGKLPLQIFDIELNNFKGEFPTSVLNCSDLTFFALSKNTFVGVIPPEIGLLNKLSTLRLDANSFSGKIPSSLANCSSMTELGLGAYPAIEAQSFPSWLTSLVNLITLGLPSMNLTGVIPGDIGKLSKLQVLLLWGNSLTGPIPATIGNCSLLQKVELDTNQLSGELPTEIWLLSLIEILFLDNNFLTGTIPPSVGNLSQVIWFYCGVNLFNGVIPVELGSMKNLQNLEMSYTGFSGNIPPSLGNTSLAVLDLSENQLTGSIPTSMSNLTGLQLLYLPGNHLQGPIPGDLMRWTQLTDLVLHSNSLSSDIPEDIGKLTSLQILELNNNKLSGVVPDSLGRCINLLHVDLSFNSLYGIIPPVVIAQLSDNLNSLNMSHNSLSGSLPPELAKLTVITYLDFSANDFSGSIPSGLADCVALTSVDLSNNNLSGSIPQSLIQLKNLAYFNVSDNNLEGPIPDGGIFATSNVTPASFFGNDGLCGSILGRACADVTPSRIAATSACKGFHCASIRIAVGCGAVGLSSVVLLLIWWFFFRKGKSNGTKAEEVVTTFESGLRMSKEDLVNIMARSENVVGMGGTSTVYKGVLGGDKIVAIKTLSIMASDYANHDYKQVEADLLREAHVLSKLRHRNILKVLGYFRSDKVVALISEFMPRGSLYDQLYVTSDDGVQRCDLNWDARLHIAVGVAHGLVYLHNQIQEPIIHRDLKPSNIFLDQTLEPKLGDFGVSRFVNPERDGEKTASTLCGTTGYIPPEYGTTTTVSTKGDIYSYGVVLLELLTRRHPVLAEESETGDCGHIVDWVLKSFEEEPIALLDASLIVDPMVNKETQIEQMKLLMRVGLLCTREKPESRPHMTDVLGMLNQILERQSDRVCLPSVAELAHNYTVWNTPEDPTSSSSMSS